MLDVECSIRGTAESYVAKVKVQHKQNPRLFEPRAVDCRSFGIQHFAGRVTYDASDFLGKRVIRAIREVKKIRRFSISDFSTTLHRNSCRPKLWKPDLTCKGPKGSSIHSRCLTLSRCLFSHPHARGGGISLSLLDLKCTCKVKLSY